MRTLTTIAPHTDHQAALSGNITLIRPVFRFVGSTLDRLHYGYYVQQAASLSLKPHVVTGHIGYVNHN